MYEPSKIMQSFFIAGFQYHDGALALKKLKPGKKLELIDDPDAVAIYRKGVHLGYVPGDSNATIAQLLRFGHANVFECRIMQVDKKADPWKQVRVGIYVTDNRKQKKAE